MRSSTPVEYAMTYWRWNLIFKSLRRELKKVFGSDDPYQFGNIGISPHLG